MSLRTVIRLFVLVAIAITTCPPAGHATETFILNHEHVLGTSLEIQIQAGTESAAQAAEACVLSEIDRLATIFSSYDATSEFSQWQNLPPGTKTVLSSELFQALRACERFHRLSGGAFNPSVDALSRIWQAGQEANKFPSAEALARGVKQANQRQWSLDETSGAATRLADGPMTLNAIAKGTIIDTVCETVLKQQPEIAGLIVNIGGDLRSRGKAATSVGITDPANDALNAAPLTTIYVANQAVATSGNYRRGFMIQGRWHSHIIDPRTGRPVEHVVSATTAAATSAEAGALATTFNVLPPAESIALAESLPGVECLIVTADGQRLQSSGWSQLEAPRLLRAEAAAELLAQAETAVERVASEPELLELIVDFEVNRPDARQLRRPYLAIWLEDENEFPVRTAVLWIQTRSPGPRWHRDLLRWYRNDNVRKLADNSELIGTISSATRGPGKYKAVFDGKDDAGNPLKPGKYTLLIEAAREHGTYQLIRHPLQLGGEPIEKATLKSNVEIKSATVEYRARTAESPAASTGN